MSSEVAHYVVTAHPPGAIQCMAKGYFLSTISDEQVAIAKLRRLEIRSSGNGDTPFPLVSSYPINGRIIYMVAILRGTLLFIITQDFQYAILSFSQGTNAVQTVINGKISATLLGKPVDTGPIVALSDHSCLAMHIYDGFLTILPIRPQHRFPAGKSENSKSAKIPSILGEPFHLRLEEFNILDITFLVGESQQLSILHQDSHGRQHIAVYGLDNSTRQLSLLWKKQRVDGGSSILIAVPPAVTSTAASTSQPSKDSDLVGSLVVMGQRQITLIGQSTHVIPLPNCLILSYCSLPPSLSGFSRYLVGDEFGKLHMLTVGSQSLALDTLGSTSLLTSAMIYMKPGWVFCGSKLGDSQLLQIHPEPIDNSYLSVLEEFVSLGPIVDMDVCGQSSTGVVTASGTSISGTLRLVRNGIGMKEFAAVEIPGIQRMWALRSSWKDKHHSFLVQSFVAETRVLGVTSNETSKNVNEECEATLEETVLQGLDSNAASLFIGNLQAGDLVLQITESHVRVLDASAGFACIQTWNPIDDSTIVVASANESGQIVIALQGGRLIYLQASDCGILTIVGNAQMPSDISCINLNPFSSSFSMEIDTPVDAETSSIVVVGLWDDFTVRVLTLDDNLTEVLQIHLNAQDEENGTENDHGFTSPVRRHRNNMMARSLCLVKLDSMTKKVGEAGVDMLFVGLGDGTLISFFVNHQENAISIRSRKEVNLGTQCIDLIPLQSEKGETCVLATGDRPAVIYLSGGGSRNQNPKLAYSNVNLTSCDNDMEAAISASERISVNSATPFVSPQLFDETAASSKHYSLCVSDDSVLRLGIIDDIQKLHVTTCRLGMAPRRVVHCPEGRVFAVGCIESGIQQVATSHGDISMGNCIRFLDETTFDDIERIDLEPHEMILSIVNVYLGTQYACQTDSPNEATSSTTKRTKPYIVIGTAYALPDEDEPTKGRVLVLSCEDDEGNPTRSVKHVTELHVNGGVYSMCQFYNGSILITVNCKTLVCNLVHDGVLKLSYIGMGHHGHILSLLVQSRASKENIEKTNKRTHKDMISPGTKIASMEDKEQLAIVGDLMRSISLLQYYPEHKALEEIARDFNCNWTTAIAMLSDNLYLGAENWGNIFMLKRNSKATSEEIRCRLETVGRYHLGEMCNKFVRGSLTMSQSNSLNTAVENSSRKQVSVASGNRNKHEDGSLNRIRRPVVSIGSQTLFGTVDGTLGCILGLNARTAAFFATLERAMSKKVYAIGNFSHTEFRTFNAENRGQPAHGFVDGDLIETFLDLDSTTMQVIVDEMNRDGGWELDSIHRKKVEGEESETVGDRYLLKVEDVVAMVEEISMMH